MPAGAPFRRRALFGNYIWEYMENMTDENREIRKTVSRASNVDEAKALLERDGIAGVVMAPSLEVACRLDPLPGPA